MKTLARYISFLYLRNIALAALGLTFLFTLNEVLRMFLDGKHPFHQILFYNGMRAVETFVEMIPPAALIGTVLTLSGLGRTNELTACYSLGIGLRNVMGVVLSLVFMISCFSLVLQDRILPPVFRKRTIYYWREMRGRSDFFIDVKQAKIWYRSKDKIYNLRSFDPITKTIHGMAVYTFDPKFNLVQVVDAAEAKYTPEGWRLREGTVTRFSEKDNFPQTRSFEEKELQIAESPTDFQEIEKEVDGLRLKELFRYIRRTAKAGVDTKSYEVQFQYRISLSFIPIVMAFLAVPFSTGRRREGGIGLDLAIGLGFTFLYWLFYSISLSMGRNGTLPPVVAAWMPSVVFAGITTLLLIRKKVE